VRFEDLRRIMRKEFLQQGQRYSLISAAGDDADEFDAVAFG